jgi:hypothetical protein
MHRSEAIRITEPTRNQYPPVGQLGEATIRYVGIHLRRYSLF